MEGDSTGHLREPATETEHGDMQPRVSYEIYLSDHQLVNLSIDEIVLTEPSVGHASLARFFPSHFVECGSSSQRLLPGRTDQLMLRGYQKQKDEKA